eukprot:1029248-Rhodomonas_salina.1
MGMGIGGEVECRLAEKVHSWTKVSVLIRTQQRLAPHATSSPDIAYTTKSNTRNHFFSTICTRNAVSCISFRGVAATRRLDQSHSHSHSFHSYPDHHDPLLGACQCRIGIRYTAKSNTRNLIPDGETQMAMISDGDDWDDDDDEDDDDSDNDGDDFDDNESSSS